jgi:acyl-CoA synthetase (AMP-forming)/AMP-acid ligase II
MKTGPQPGVMTMDSVVRRGARRTPDKVVLSDATASWTWRDFDQHVDRAARALIELGVGPGDRVAAAGYNSAEYFAVYYGAARLGAILVPLNYLSAADEMRFVLGDADPAAILVEDEFKDLIGGAAKAAAPGATLLDFNSPGAEWAQRTAAAANVGDELPAPDPESIHVVMYTSGTTGRPKGVCHTQRAHYVDGLSTALGFGLGPSDGYVVHAPSFHGASWDHAKLFLFCDGKVAITPRFEAESLMRETAAHGASVLFGVPAVLRLLLGHESWGRYDLSCVRIVYFGGALGSPAILGEFAEALGRSVDYVQVYGLTEGGPWCTMSPPELVDSKPKSIGKPLPAVEIDTVDPETGEPVATGEVGELVMRGPTIMSGYWRNEEATAATLRDGWLHTGDLAVRDADGDYRIVDRLKDMIRSGGENVYAAEVERVLLEHPEIAEAAVVGLPDERWDERVVGVVLCRSGATLEEEALLEFCRGRLARYKVPKQLEFVADFPRTGLGKIAKPELRAQLLGEG